MTFGVGVIGVGNMGRAMAERLGTRGWVLCRGRWGAHGTGRPGRFVSRSHQGARTSRGFWES